MKKNPSIHVTLAMIVSLLLTIFLAGCNGTESIKDSSAGIISDSEDGTKSAAPLADYDGWWYIDEDSHDGVCDALGTSSGEDAISFCTLVQTNLWHGDDGNYLYFVEGGIFKLSSPNEKGEIKPYDGGAWSLTGEELLLVWDNGVKETVAFRAGDGISVPSLNEIFTAAR